MHVPARAWAWIFLTSAAYTKCKGGHSQDAGEKWGKAVLHICCFVDKYKEMPFNFYIRNALKELWLDSLRFWQMLKKIKFPVIFQWQIFML